MFLLASVMLSAVYIGSSNTRWVGVEDAVGSRGVTTEELPLYTGVTSCSRLGCETLFCWWH